MKRHDVLSPLQGALSALTAWLKAERVEYTFIGGLAAAFLGRPRMTRDIDVLIRVDDEGCLRLLDSGGRWGFVPRIGDSLEFARVSRVLLVRHEESAVDVDLVLASLPFEEDVIKNGVCRDVGGLSIRLPRPEDLIVMKAVAHRPRDIADIEGIVDAQQSLDWESIAQVAGEFAEALAASEILRTVETFRRRHKTDRG